MDNIQMNQGIAIMQTALWIVGLFTLLSGIVGVSNITVSYTHLPLDLHVLSL